MRLQGQSFGVLGALSALPLRLAARRVTELGGKIHRGATRASTQLVVGRSLLRRHDETEIERRLAEASVRRLPMLSENGFFRLIDGTRADGGDLSRGSMLEQSRMEASPFDRLTLFDAFRHDLEPFSFTDLILARKYAGLLAGGASWSAIARSVHAIGPVTSLTALTLERAQGGRILSRDRSSYAELDGQRLLPFGEAAEEGEDYFALAEQAEEAGLIAEAATLYRQCLSADPCEATAAFNLGNCEKALGDSEAAALAFLTAIKRDPEFIEAWFNLACVLKEMGRTDAARTHLHRAIELDPSYADAIYNLAALEYDSGDLAAARTWWLRYLEFDATSDWAKRARAGIGIIERRLRKIAG